MPRFDALGLVVEDMGAPWPSIAALGLEIPPEADAEGHAEATLPGGLRLMFDTIEVVRSFSAWEPPTGGHRVALAFLCASPAEVEPSTPSWWSAGHRSHLAPFDAFWGQRYATLLDPDGNPVDLFAPLG